MKYFRLFKILFITFLLTFCLNSCIKELPPDEQYYKENVKELNKLLESYFGIQVRVTKNENFNDENNYLESITITYNEDDINKRIKFFNKNKDKWLQLDNSLKLLPIKYPNSKWCDDASFYRVFEVIVAQYPYDYWASHVIESASYFIENYENFDIDKWTRKRMDKVFPVIWDDMIAYHGTSENEMIRAAVFSMLVTQYCMNKDFSAARATVKRIEKTNFSYEEFATGLKNYIEFLEKRTL